jgi:16S rRNA (uracil1498-N3)-methyltransferase
MAHFYLPPEEWTSDQTLVLRGDEARHCQQVLRHGVGDVIHLMDGRGRVASGPISRMAKQEVEIQVSDLRQHPAPTAPVTLVQAIPKGEGMDWIIEKAVELGVQRILPLCSERTIVRLTGEQAEKKQQRWQRRVIEACKQCGQLWMPDLLLPQSLESALATTAAAPIRLIASLEPGSDWIQNQVLSFQGEVALAIGPEGDFSPAEYQRFREAGWKPVHLGPLVLRCETAAIAAVAVLQNHLASRSTP